MSDQTVKLAAHTGLELENIQCNVVTALNPVYAQYITLKILDAAVLQALLQSLLNAPDLQIFTDKRNNDAAVACNIALSATGLRRLGLAESLYQSLPLAFREGMAFRADFTGDADASAPENWQGFYGSNSADLMLVFYARETHAIDDCIDRFLIKPGITLLDREPGQTCLNTRGDATEHFGFRDGISQPFLHLGGHNDGQADDGRVGNGLIGGGRIINQQGQKRWAPLAAGEFILGYENEQHRALKAQNSLHYREDYVDQPLPAQQNAVSNSYAQLVKNGSFMVFRKLQQHLPLFNDLTEERDSVAELVVGRSKQGDLLTEQQIGQSTSCPYASSIAHIDRCNPRLRLSFGGADSSAVDQHRIIRRGIPYGDPAIGDADYGLLFVCYNSRIDTQFEFIQREWINKADAFNEYNDVRDPIAQTNNQASYFYWYEADGSIKRSRHHGLVTLRGGDYFFVPGKVALQQIANRGLASFSKSLPQLNTMLSDAAEPGTKQSPLEFSEIWQTTPTLKNHRGAAYSPSQFDPIAAAKTLNVPGLASLAGIEVRQIVHEQQRETVYYLTQPEHIDGVLDKPDLFTTEDYAHRIQELSGSWMLLGESPKPPREARREFMRESLARAHAAYHSQIPVWIETLIKTHGRDGLVDIVALARELPLRIVSSYFGARTPRAEELSEQHYEGLISDYFGRAQGQKIAPGIAQQFPPSLRTAKNVWFFWIRSVFVHVFLNLYNVTRIRETALQSSHHLCSFIDSAINDANAPDNDVPEFSVLAQMQGDASFNAAEQRQILLEFIVGSFETALKGLVSISETFLDDPSVRLQATQLLQGNAEPQAWDLLIRGLLMRDPVAPISFRKCPMGTQLQQAGNIEIAPGSWVYLLNEAAAKIAYAKGFADPFFDFGRHSAHGCLGQEVALSLMREWLKELTKLQDLRRVAGPRGQLSKHWALPQQLYVRFDPSSLANASR